MPAGKHLRVHEGDRVRAGDRLSEGPVNPHDILRIKGPRAVQEYLLNEVQEVYRLQGVKINDKHIGVIVQADAAEGAHHRARATPSSSRASTSTARSSATRTSGRRRRSRSRRRPSRCCFGITKASLTTQSFISAASFQETTRVLTDAAIRGAKDDLLGLKENIIIGHLIPAGTGHVPVPGSGDRGDGDAGGGGTAAGFERAVAGDLQSVVRGDWVQSWWGRLRRVTG